MFFFLRQVWFGDCEAETICRSEENMIAVVPDRKLIQPDWDPKCSDPLYVSYQLIIRCTNFEFQVPISLVRSDGVIYPYDDEKFTYCPALITTSEPPGKRARVDNDSYAAASSLSQITPNVSVASCTNVNPDFGDFS